MNKQAFPQRKPTRLKGYDYGSVGIYFVTVCTHKKQHLFGKIINQKMCLNGIGHIVEQEITNIESRYANIKIHNFVVMPNHIHFLMEIVNPTERINPFPTIKRYDISNVIGKFKAGVTRTVGNAFMHSVSLPIWQRSFHDHIIRGDEDYGGIWNTLQPIPGNGNPIVFIPNKTISCRGGVSPPV